MKPISLICALSLAFQFSLFSELAKIQIAGWGPNPSEDFYTEADRFVFFAVLEGCYNTGLVTEDVDQIMPNTFTNFVLSCPLCGPASDAFRLYSERKQLSKQIIKRSSYRTFGPGLDPEIKEKLQKPGQSCRDAIQGLIGRWIDERIQKLRLTEEETNALRQELAKMRKKGEKALTTFQNAEDGNELRERYKDWKACPVCSGASPMGGSKE